MVPKLNLLLHSTFTLVPRQKLGLNDAGFSGMHLSQKWQPPCLFSLKASDSVQLSCPALWKSLVVYQQEWNVHGDKDYVAPVLNAMLTWSITVSSKYSVNKQMNNYTTSDHLPPSLIPKISLWTLPPGSLIRVLYSKNWQLTPNLACQITTN